MAGRKPKGNVYVARESFSCEINGELINVAKGERVREGHDLIRIYPDAFEDVREGAVKWDLPDVEQATASPGEKRGTPTD